MKFLWRAVFICIFALVASLTAGFWLNVWLPSRFSMVENATSSSTVQTLARALLIEKSLGEIGNPPYGDEGWYKTLLNEQGSVLHLGLAERVDFYAIMLLNFDFGPESVDTFIHMIKPDAGQFRDALAAFKKSEKFASLPKKQQILIVSWQEKANAIFLKGDM